MLELPNKTAKEPYSPGPAPVWLRGPPRDVNLLSPVTCQLEGKVATPTQVGSGWAGREDAGGPIPLNVL